MARSPSFCRDPPPQVDHEAIAHVSAREARQRVVERSWRDDLNAGDDPVFGATSSGAMPLDAHDLAHIVALEARGLKASTATLAEFQRLTDGLIAMAAATVGAH